MGCRRATTPISRQRNPSWISCSTLDRLEVLNIEHKEAQASVTINVSTLSFCEQPVQPFPKTLVLLVNANKHKTPFHFKKEWPLLFR